MKVEIITNSKGSGDYIVVTCNEERVFEGHRITATDLAYIIESTDGFSELSVSNVTDEEMEEF